MKSESGQAALEYILLLIITVALILGLIMHLFTPLSDYVSSYMGDYTACLLQSGELPSFGDDKSRSELESQGCDKKFEIGTLSQGRPPIAGGEAEPSDSKSERNSGGGRQSARTSSEGSSSSGGGGGSSGGNLDSRFGRQGTQSGESSASDSKRIEIAIETPGSGGFFGGRTMQIEQARKQKSLAISGAQFSEEQQKKIEKGLADGRRTVASDLAGSPPKKLAVKPPVKAVEEVKEEGEFTIGSFMRMLFIIAIILAIVIFVGGQVLQMSKNSD